MGKSRLGFRTICARSGNRISIRCCLNKTMGDMYYELDRTALFGTHINRFAVPVQPGDGWCGCGANNDRHYHRSSHIRVLFFVLVVFFLFFLIPFVRAADRRMWWSCPDCCQDIIRKCIWTITQVIRWWAKDKDKEHRRSFLITQIYSFIMYYKGAMSAILYAIYHIYMWTEMRTSILSNSWRGTI